MSCRETWQWHEDWRMAQFLVCTWAIYTVDSYLRYSTYLLRRWTKSRHQEAHLVFPWYFLTVDRTDGGQCPPTRLPRIRNGEIIKSQMVRCKHHGERKGSRAKSVFSLGDATPGHGPTPRKINYPRIQTKIPSGDSRAGGSKSIQRL